MFSGLMWLVEIPTNFQKPLIAIPTVQGVCEIVYWMSAGKYVKEPIKMVISQDEVCVWLSAQGQWE